MSERKDIVLDGQVIGDCIVTREGLYYRFQCSCRFEDRRVHKLFVKASPNIIPLGVCIPSGDKFVLDKRIPITKIGNAIRSVLADHPGSTYQRIDLSHLQNAYLNSNGQLAFRDQSPDPQGSDLNQGCLHES